MKEKEQEIVVRDQSCVALAKFIKGTVDEFPPEVSHEDEYLDAKVSQLSWNAVELKKQFEELQARQVPSTPPKVLEERSKVVLAAEERIK